MVALFSPTASLIQSCITVILQLIVASCFGSILYWHLIAKNKRPFSLEFTSSVCFYAISEVVTTCICMPYMIYLIIFWQPEIATYNAYWLFFTGCMQSLGMITNPVTVFFLGVDRCVHILNPFYAKKLNTLIFCLTIVTMVVLVTIDGIFHLILSFPDSEITECRSFGCLLTTQSGQVYTVLRILLCTANIIVGIILIWLVKTKTIAKKATMKTTRLVLMTILMDLIFVFIPHFTSFILFTIYGINITKFIGPYSLFVTSINSSFCAIMYYKATRKSMKKPRSIGRKSKPSVAPVMVAIEK